MTDAWVLAGQSNMEGCAPVPDEMPACEGAVTLGFDGYWKPATDPLHRFHESKTSWHYRFRRVQFPDLDDLVARGIFPGSAFGPGTAFAAEIMRRTGTAVGLIPCALGGTPIAMWDRNWAWPEAGFEVGDSLFCNMIARCRLAADAGMHVAGVLWYQGESDATTAGAPHYLGALQGFIQEVRDALGHPDLRFVIVQLANVDGWEPASDRGWEDVREAQRRAAAELENVTIVAAGDLPTMDGLHLGSEAQRVLGHRLATAVVDGAPNVIDVVAAEDALSIRCVVTGAAGAIRGASASFRIVDKAGAPVEDQRVVRITGTPDACILELERPHLPGDLVVYGAGRGGHAGVLDGAGFPLPFFGPIEPKLEA